MRNASKLLYIFFTLGVCIPASAGQLTLPDDKVDTADEVYSINSNFSELYKGKLDLRPGNTIPNTDNYYNLGSTTYRWKNLYAAGISVSTITASSATLTSLDVSSITCITAGISVDTNVLYVDCSNNRVGVNTSSPQRAFHVVGSSGQVPSFPTVGANTVAIFENNTNANISIISAGSSASSLAWSESGDTSARGTLQFSPGSPYKFNHIVNGNTSVVISSYDFTSQGVVNITTPSACLVYLSSGGLTQTIIDSSNVVVGIDAKQYDYRNEYSTTTKLFTATVAGGYSVCIMAEWDSPVDQIRYQPNLFKNGASIAIQRYNASGTNRLGTGFCRDTVLAVGDTLQFRVRQESGVDDTIQGNTAAATTWMQIHKIW